MVEGRAGGAPGDGLRIAREAMWAYFVLLPAAVAGAVILRRRRVQILALFAQALIATVIAAGTFGLTRYRAGVEVSIVVLAAVDCRVGVVEAHRCRRRRTRARAAASAR